MVNLSTEQRNMFRGNLTPCSSPFSLFRPIFVIRCTPNHSHVVFAISTAMIRDIQDDLCRWKATVRDDKLTGMTTA